MEFWWGFLSGSAVAAVLTLVLLVWLAGGE